MSLPLPTSEEEITPEWLRAALSQSFPNATFASLDYERIGEDYGFASRIIRCRWVDGDAPQSVVIKLWNTNDGAGTGEISFYKAFPDVGTRIPACYFGGIDEENNTAVLLLEDFENAIQGDVLRLADSEQAEGIANCLATMHATWLENPELSAHTWVANISNWQPEADWFDSRRALFRERFESRLSGLASLLLDRIEVAPNIVNGRFAKAPQTLLHGDFHLDNILFVDHDQPVSLDWSRPVIGPSAYNLAELLFGMIPFQLFDSIFGTYLDAFNRIAAKPLSKPDLESQLGGAFLRRFAMSTCGIARWQPTLPRAIKTIDRSLRQTNESVEFWQERDPDLFSFLTV